MGVSQRMTKRTSDKASAPELPVLSTVEDDIDPTQTKVRASKVKTGESPANERPALTILEGSNFGQMHLLKGEQVIIGRAPDANIRIEDDGVSRRHVRLTIEGLIVHAEDLKSANGTLVNGVGIDGRRELVSGDKIAIGANTVMKFAYVDDLEASFQQKMLDAALRDGLTGAYNKRYLMERLGTELAFAARHKAPFTLLLFDLDHFKKINDTYGHPAGDEVLVGFAHAVNETIRKEDVFARFGGEEFAVLCRNIDVTQGAILAERIRARVGLMEIEHPMGSIKVAVSAGVAGVTDREPEATTQHLIAGADEALYQAKHSGRNRVIVKR